MNDYPHDYYTDGYGEGHARFLCVQCGKIARIPLPMSFEIYIAAIRGLNDASECEAQMYGGVQMGLDAARAAV